MSSPGIRLAAHTRRVAWWVVAALCSVAALVAAGLAAAAGMRLG